MLLRKFSQTIKVGIAMLLAVLSSGLTNIPIAYATTNPIEAQALADHDCDSTEWHFLINQIDSEANAPASINVTWSNNATETVTRNNFTGQVAHYTTTSNLTSTVTSATAVIYTGWDGQFNLSHGPCVETETPTGTLTVSTECEEIVFGGSDIIPENSTVTFELNDVVTAAGNHTVAAGSHKVEMFVNGTLVDSEMVTVEECEDDATYVTPTVTPVHQTSVCIEGEEVFTSGSITVTAQEGLHYWLNDTEIEGSANVAPGTHEVVLTTDEGVELSEGATSPISVTVNAASALECEVADTESVTLCHATRSEKNPFVRITIDAEGAFNGHFGESHQNGRDIIPPFTYNGQTYSQNWTEGMVITEECDTAVEVIPAQVQFLNPTCENPVGRAVIPVTEGVTYKVGDDVVTGTVTYPAGASVTVTAEASDESYVIDEEATVSWSHTFTAAPTGCVLGDNDVCPNIEGTQTVVPVGFAKNPTTGDCFTPGRGAGVTTTGGQTLSASTELPETLPATGGEANPFLILVASLIAYGAAYFLQGRRLLGRNSALSA